MNGLRASMVAVVVGGLVLAVPANALAADADLAVDASASTAQATVGTEFTFVADVSNGGPGAASGVELVDDLPNQVDIVAATPSQGSCKEQGSKVTCELGTVEPGGTASLSIRVIANKAGEFVHQATVSSADTDSQPANNTDTATVNVVEPPPAPTCDGVEATVVGTEGNDRLVGTDKRDVIVGLGGDDVIDGLAGNDLVCAAAGADTVKGEAGDDTIRSGGGDDILRGGDGRDMLRGGGGLDRLAGGADADLLRGGGGADTCVGGPGSDEQHSC